MQASNPPFIRFCKKLGLLPEKVSFYLSDSFFLLLSLVIAFCSVCRKASRQVRILQLYAPDDAIGAIPDSQEEEEQSGQ